jgi:ribosomal protein L29
MADKKAKAAAEKATKAVKAVEKKAPKTTDYKVMTVKDLEKAVVALREDVIVLKRGTAMGDVQNVRAYGTRRKELARALTVLNVKYREEK